MKTFAASLFVGLAATTVFGQAVDLQVLKRAQRLNDQNNARQGVSAPAPAVQSGPAPRAQPDPVLAATLQNIAALQADFTSLESDPVRKQPLINDLNAAAQSSHPSKNPVSRLADDLAGALGGKHSSQEQLKKLAQDVHAMFNSSHLTQTQQQTIPDDVRKILQGGGASSDEAAKVVNDIKTVVAETR
jgi:hypothetical protein